MDLTGVSWRKSSYSGGNTDGDGCVEVGFLPGGAMALRDTKDRSLAPHLYSPTAWADFLTHIRADQHPDPAQVTHLPDGSVTVRDRHNTESTPHRFTPLEWDCFVKAVRAGEFDHR